MKRPDNLPPVLGPTARDERAGVAIDTTISYSTGGSA